MENTTRTPGKTPTGTHDKIELRSEKVCKLIGEIPPSLVRWGAAIIAFVFLAYPYSPGETILHHLLN